MTPEINRPRPRPVGALGLTVAGAALLLCGGTASALPAFGLTTSGTGLVGFNTEAVGTITSTVAISGLASGETLLNIDARPRTGELYALSSQNRMYKINTATGAATQVLTAGAAPFTLNGSVAMDFNPAVDRIRVTTSTGQNLRLNPDTGGLVADDSATNGLVRYDAGDPNAAVTPRPVAVAYTNTVLGGPAPAATATTMYVMDVQSGFDRRLTTQGSINSTPVSPNLGRLFTIAPVFGLFAAGDNYGMDIMRVGSADLAFFSGQTLVGTTAFYSLNLATGSLGFLGAVGDGSVTIRNFALVPAPGAAAFVGAAGLLAARRRR